MEFREYQQKATATFKEHESARDEACDWMVSLAEEVGEVASLIKHHLWGGEDLDREKLAKEVGDVLWYLTALCTTTGVDLDTVAKLNIAKLDHRYSSGGFTIEGSQARHELEAKFEETPTYRQLITELSYISSKEAYEHLW